MERFLLQRFAELEEQQPPRAQEPVHYTESLATLVIEELSSPGDIVLDPFAGYGTTLVVAERLGRRPLGLELLPERASLIAGRLADPDGVATGDARELGGLIDAEPGAVALVLTSPPYMTRNDHPENPLDAYTTNTGDYASYLADVGSVFEQVRMLLRPGGHAVVNAANIVHDDVLTPLAWDLSRVIGEHLRFVQDCYLAWDAQPPDISGDYLLVFRKD